MKQITILGSTGSIGQNSLEVIRHLGEGYRVVALAVHSQIDRLEQQIHAFNPEVVAVYDEKKALELQARVPHVPVLAGMDGLLAVASHSNTNFVISAMSGTIGLAPTLAAINAGKTIGLANKEALVTGGALVKECANRMNVSLLPIDSEHCAIFQCLQGEKKHDVRRLILTASGGPFRSYTPDQLNNVTVAQALNHPTWKMGPKITIDSSTLMNKGLEVIEAHWLFDIPIEQIEVVIHPQSLVHSMVEFNDLSTIAQISEPSMVLPIQYCLTHPDRHPGLLKPLDLTKARTLEFFPPDITKFRCLALAFEAIRQGGSLPAYMNAANEILVERFLKGEFSWPEIGSKLESLMEKHPIIPIPTHETITAIDSLARQQALTC